MVHEILEKFGLTQSEAKIVGMGAHWQSWEKAFWKILSHRDNPFFTHYFPISGESHSVRVFLVEDCPGVEAAPLPKPLSSIDTAKELLRFSSNGARYNDDGKCIQKYCTPCQNIA